MNVLFNILASLNSGTSEPVPGVKPLTLRNVGTDSANISITKTGTPTVDGLQYRMEGKKSWLPYTIDTEITVNPNKAVQFQNTNEMLNIEFTGDGWTVNAAYFVIPDGTKFNAEGNIQSMLNYSDSVSDYCFIGLFHSCNGLVDASQLELPATTLATNCYSIMFANCPSLVNVPELPALNLAKGCYNGMFSQCTSLKIAPELPATTLAQSCYNNMFNNCLSLIIPPELPATTLANSCYSTMFQFCPSLVNVPELPATTLADYCYQNMFYGCTSLVNAPELPATTLEYRCYENMFNGCTSLVNAPELPGAILEYNSYANMFDGCTSLSSIKVALKRWYSSYTYRWVEGVSPTGTFYKLSTLPKEFGPDRIPSGWTVTNFDEIGDSEGGDDDSSSSELKFTLAGSQYNDGVLNGEYVETEDSKTARNGSFNNCTIRATKKDNSDCYIKIQIGDSSSDAFGTGIKACYVEAYEGTVYEVSSMFGYMLFAYMGDDDQLSLTLTSNNSTLNNTVAFQALKTLFLNK